MAGKLLQFSGLTGKTPGGSFRGLYSINEGTGDADMVVIQLASQNTPLVTRMRSCRVTMFAITQTTSETGYFADWAIVKGDVTAAFQSINAATPVSGTAIGPGSVQVGYAFTPSAGINTPLAGCQSELAGGRVFMVACTAAQPFSAGPAEPQYLWPGEAAPTSDPGDILQFVLLGPTTVSGPQSGARNFAFHIDLHGEYLSPSAPQYGNFTMSRPIPPAPAPR